MHLRKKIRLKTWQKHPLSLWQALKRPPRLVPKRTVVFFEQFFLGADIWSEVSMMKALAVLIVGALAVHASILPSSMAHPTTTNGVSISPRSFGTVLVLSQTATALHFLLVTMHEYTFEDWRERTKKITGLAKTTWTRSLSRKSPVFFFRISFSYNREVLQTEFRFRFRKGPRQISAGPGWSTPEKVETTFLFCKPNFSFSVRFDQ